MPVGRPDPDGTPMRAYRGQPHPLGQVGEWKCVACDGVNTGAMEQGCTHCGAGVPGAKGEKRVEQRPNERTDRQTPSSRAVVSAATRPEGEPALRASVELSPTKIYRLLEYDIRSMPGAVETLQRSLVGSLDLGWGTLTATIVDSVDGRQTDLLSLAKRQPGVWLANKLAMGAGARSEITAERRDRPELRDRKPNPFVQAAQEREMAEQRGPVPPSPHDRDVARVITTVSGYQGAYTIAQALSMYAEQVAQGSLEREKHWDEARCLGVAQALLDLIPADWDPAPGEGESGAEQPTIAEG